MAARPNGPASVYSLISDATHIFDGLHPFPTQVCHMLLGKTVAPPLPWPPAENDTGPKELFKLALGWLKEDKVVRKEREKVTGRIRGPKAEVSLASSSPLCTQYLLPVTISSCLYLLYSFIISPFLLLASPASTTLTLV